MRNAQQRTTVPKPAPKFAKDDMVFCRKVGCTKRVWGSRWDGAEYRYVLVDEQGVRDHGYLEDELEKPPVPRAKVEELAAAAREMLALKDRQAVTQAQLIRWCLYALKQTTAQAQRTLERERRSLPTHRQRVGMHEPQKKVNDDRRLAMLHLEWLATQLEGPAPAPLDLAAVPDNLRKSGG